MRTPSAALLYTLVSLLLAQALAAAPPQQPNSQSTRSKGINAREAIRWLEAQRTEDVRPKFSVRLAPGGGVSSTVTDLMAPRDPHPTTDTAPPVEARDEITHTERSSALVEVREEKALTERAIVDGKHQPLLSVEREAAPAPAEAGQNLDYPTLVVRSAAPKVLGINIFLIIAWLVFMYLMYRTGSI